MKKIVISALLLFAQLFTLSGVPSAADTPNTEVIVTVTPPYGADPYDYALECATELSGRIPNCEYGYIYDTLLCGFTLKLPNNAVRLLSAYGFVTDVYGTAEYKTLSYGEKEMLAAEMVGVTDAMTDGLTGDGVKVAVIDNSFDVTHPAFDAEVRQTLDLSEYEMQIGIAVRLNALRYILDVQKFRHSSKIPFRFDYADFDTDVYDETNNHGTHVAGIIGAAPTEESSMQGIAPGCQLLLMKVFSDGAGSASDTALIAALEDAVKLGADVINLSIGHFAGSTDMNTIGLSSVLTKARESGCVIICAAGNDGVSTDRSVTKYPLAGYTDYGTLSAPASAESTIAVASVDNAVEYGEFFRHAENKSLSITYTDTNLTSGILEGSFSEFFSGKTLEYAIVPGIGEESDYTGIDVYGKLALIKRGTITFVDKVNTAAAHGAIGAVIYNNEAEEYINMELTGAKIPAIAISLEDGEALIAEEIKKLMFSTDFTYREQSETAGMISHFSSRGTTPSLTLKPDITAVGGSVYSTVNGGGYAGMSGTSMASPQLAGIYALLKEKSRRDGVESDIAIALMNSAVPVMQANGVEYSPRAQGAGLVNFDSVQRRELEITYAQNGKPKAELFDGLKDTFTFDVTVKNITAAKLNVSLGATLTNDGWSENASGEKIDYYSTLESVADTVSKITAADIGNLNRYANDYSPLVFTLDAGESKTLSITAVLDKGYHDTLSGIFTNGYFAEGFVYCRTDSSTVSMPYMGYIGDFAAAPVLDGDAYALETYMFDSAKLMIAYDGAFLPAGANVFTKPYTFDRSTIAFSPNHDGYADTLYFAAAQLRNVRSAVMTVRDSEGEVISVIRENYRRKLAGLDETVVFWSFWDGGDGMHDMYRLPDGKYTFEVIYTLDYGVNKVQTYSYDIMIDTKPPTVSKLEYTDGILRISAEDESGVQCICAYEGNPEDKTPYLEPAGEAQFDISELTGDILYYEIIDSAYNICVGRLSLSELSGKEMVGNEN